MRVLMIGAGRDVRGGVSSVVNGYYDAGLDKRCELTYLPTMEDGSKWKKLLVAAKARLRFEWLIRKHDILHVHMSADNSFYRKAMFIRRAHQKKKKIIIHMHGSTFDQFYLERCDERQKSGVWHIFAMADCVLALSEAWQYFLAKHVCSHDKIQVLYNAVKLPDPYEKNYTCRNILFLGKLGQRKGTYDLIEILPDICRKYPDVHIYFCGDGEQEQAKALCREKGILEYVTFSGWVRGSEKEKLLRECSIYALPTYHEGMPMSVLEAMSYGLAVVSTYVGGIPHIIHDGENGLLLEAGDREQLKEKLYQVLANETIRETLGTGAVKTIAEQFDVRKNIDKLMNIYEHLTE
ncbi:MAG: glycosyltransferase family 4 protein [Lachnospiraceae bacterium]|nr:glycosyltransferase family 4 protein [Lachnospiraceae bacterium]